MRKAFSLIELVFAIVLAGIASTILPTIIGSSSDSDVESLIYGQLIYAADQQAFILFDSAWDNNGTNILQTYRWLSKKRCTGSNVRINRCLMANRIGVQPTYQPTPRNNFNFISDKDVDLGSVHRTSVNNFDGLSRNVQKIVGENNFVNMNVSVQVGYVPDLPSSGTFNNPTLNFNFSDKYTPSTSSGVTNLKMYEVTATNTEKDPRIAEKVIFRVYGANIGSNTQTVAGASFK